ncbi:YceI family protein [Glaciimonas immobilis]|uniref:Polyisoprenoid-binding protein YceI n=1 Tax=Glaciimonas immobilis TaxID=728004 RepID=A0A840RXK2_9BURK|nr:YceI family protein [Glaciimonas immobilis]KAF3995917.1 YceI family protein [Glaciimonas immobilis]MBB5202635.1 polyisoprenoid-binding protein YceI [Glaciimonas immobilis]
MPPRLVNINSLFFLLIALTFSAVSVAASAAEHYTIDPEHTFVSFEYSHWGLSMQRNRFDRSAGYIALDQPSGPGEIMIEIDAASVNTGTELFNKILRASDFFDAEKYPKIRFTSSHLFFDGDNLKQVEGELTIKDVTRTVSLEVTSFNCRFMVLYGKRACGANGFVKILRSDYHLGRFVPFVSDEVTLHIVVEAIKDY